MTERQGTMDVRQLCALAGLSRAGFYRHWQASAPRREEVALRDVLQHLHLAHRHYGYRRIAALLRREGWQVNHKRALHGVGGGPERRRSDPIFENRSQDEEILLCDCVRAFEFLRRAIY